MYGEVKYTYSKNLEPHGVSLGLFGKYYDGKQAFIFVALELLNDYISVCINFEYSCLIYSSLQKIDPGSA